MLTCEVLALVLLLLLINYKKYHHFTIQIRVFKLGVKEMRLIGGQVIIKLEKHLSY